MDETKYPRQYENPGNLLYDIKSLITELPLKFREIISHECAWSFATFYRKMRTSSNDKNTFSNLSNAEINMVFTVMDGIMDDFVREYEEYKTDTQKNILEMD
ncbi:hypothetical protein [Chitinophaga pinensis]|uniref:Uncharacterized protein n=1 Tax=Chitinophaga pinensis TaxID=79329 RepID=A0A5C6LQP8_9BACT|nr:hypothetical protein [Chitinophaga pinensis]TWV95659.1 hypothetical protein FEF09_24145 [Chitinophaga pinensis]